MLGMGAGALAAAVGAQPIAALANAPIDHVDHFRRLRLNLIDSDNMYGARSVLPFISDNIGIMNQLRQAGIGPGVELLRMQTLYAELAAWLNQDLRTWNDAQYWTDRTLEWSHMLGDPYYVAAALIRKAQIANDRGDGADAVELAGAAERAAPAGTRFGAVAETFAGWGAALVGDRERSDRSFDRARALAADANADPSWGLFLDSAYIDVHQAHALALLGDHARAIAMFDAAIATMQTGYTRDKGVYLARQSMAYASSGEIEGAASTGHLALQIGVSTGSHRILDTIRQVDKMIDPTSKQPAVVELRDSMQRWKVAV